MRKYAIENSFVHLVTVKIFKLISTLDGSVIVPLAVKI